MEKLITRKLWKGNSPFDRCGGYDGISSTVVGWPHKRVDMTSTETAFGNYLYAIRVLVNGREGDVMGSEKYSDDYVQGKIDTYAALLEDLALTYIDKENRVAKFNEREDFPKSLFTIGALMPYVIQYVAQKNGLNFEDRQAAQHTDSFIYLNEKLVDVVPYTDLDLITSIATARGDDPKKYLPEKEKTL